MSRRALYGLLLRLALAWASLAVLVSWLGPQLLVAAKPALQLTTEWLLPGFITSVALAPNLRGDGDVAMDLQAVRPVPITGDHEITPFVKVQERINAGHDLVPMIIMCAVLLAWPYRHRREAAWALAWGVVASAALTIWVTSVHFAGLFEIKLQRVADHFEQTREAPFYLAQMLFFESGGQWLSALVCAMSVGLLSTRRSMRDAVLTVGSESSASEAGCHKAGPERQGHPSSGPGG